MNKIFLIFLLSIGAVAAYTIYLYNTPGEYDEFAQCLTDESAKFYGTFWCSYCGKQKELLGKSMKYVDYVECSTSDRRSQTKICQENNITGYPTWEFKNGSRVGGVLTLVQLSNLTGCKV